MKPTLFSILLVLAIMLSGCGESGPLPPEPEAPGIAGNYYRSIGDWATEPDTFTIEKTSSHIQLAITDDDFIYKNLYVWHEGETRWVPLQFTQDATADSLWIANTASLELEINSYLDYKDASNEIFFAAYSCSWVDSSWDCNNNKWQLQIETIEKYVPESDLESGDVMNQDDSKDSSENTNPVIEEITDTSELPAPPTDPNLLD